MSEYIKNASDLIEQGHVRVGTDVVKDPAFLVSRTLEDFVTWVDGSKIRKHVMEYNNMVSADGQIYQKHSTVVLTFAFSISAGRLWHVKELHGDNVEFYFFYRFFGKLKIIEMKSFLCILMFTY